MAVEPPWMYSAEPPNDSRFPTTSFDPKAVTRASWVKKAPKPKQDEPLISFNRHPDAHMVLTNRSNPYTPMSSHTKKWIKWLRQLQLLLRVFEFNASVGILVLMVLLTKLDPAKGWILRIASGVISVHCIYSVYHLSRDAAGRTATSSAAYQVFAALADFCTLGFLAFGAITTHNEAGSWANRLTDQSLTSDFVLAVYYTMVGTGGLHLISLLLSLWLAYKFRKISLMPPDMNPLEDNLTTRPRHKRNKSSTTTLGSAESDKGVSVPLENQPRPGMPCEGTSRPPTVSFMHTRQGSSVSFGSRDSRFNFPSRQYQIVPGNSARDSAMSAEPKRMSRPMSAYRSSYAGVPLDDPTSMSVESEQQGSIKGGHVGELSKTSAPTHSFLSRTNQRNQSVAAATRQNIQDNTSYASLTQRYNIDDPYDSDHGNDDGLVGNNNEVELSQGGHPNPLRSNPPPTSRTIATRVKTPFHRQNSGNSAEYSNTFCGLSPSRRPEFHPGDIAAETTTASSRSWQRNGQHPGQEDSGFCSKPYGELKRATTTIMVGNDRKVSSGNDYDKHRYQSTTYERRNVSGKEAEEGRAGNRSSRYESYMNKNW